MAKKTPNKDHTFSPVKAGLVHGVLSSRTANDVSPVMRFSSNTASPEVPRPPPQARAQQQPVLGPRVACARFTREKRILLTASEEIAVDAFVQRLCSNGATSLKLSHLLRACMLVLRHSERELIAQVHASPPLIRPANGNSHALGEFERCIAHHVASAIRRTLPLP